MNVCILARKKLRYNTRVVRQAASLSNAGYRVIIVSLENPVEALRRNIPGVLFYEIHLHPWPLLILSGLRYVNRMFVYVKTGIAIVFLGKEEVLSRKDAERINHLNKKTHNGFLQRITRLLNPFVNMTKSRQFARRASRALRDQHIDFVQAHDSFSLIAAQKISDNKDTRLIYDATEAPDERSGDALSGAPEWFRKMENNMESEIIRRAAGIITVGPSLSTWTENKYSVDRPVVIRNCSLYRANEYESSIRNDTGITEDATLGIVIGSIYRGQGLEKLAKGLLYARPGIHIAAIGPLTQKGYADELYNYIRDIKVEERFHILPAKPQNEIVSYASGADFGIVALQPDRLNHRLALPNKIFEYIMARLPVASGNIPDVLELLEQHEIGIQFDETNPEDIGKCLSDLSSLDKLCELRKNVINAAEILNWEQEGEKYVKAIQHFQ